MKTNVMLRGLGAAGSFITGLVLMLAAHAAFALYDWRVRRIHRRIAR